MCELTSVAAQVVLNSLADASADRAASHPQASCRPTSAASSQTVAVVNQSADRAALHPQASCRPASAPSSQTVAVVHLVPPKNRKEKQSNACQEALQAMLAAIMSTSVGHDIKEPAMVLRTTSLARSYLLPVLRAVSRRS